MKITFFTLIGLLLLTGKSNADNIYLKDGSVLKNVKIDTSGAMAEITLGSHHTIFKEKSSVVHIVRSIYIPEDANNSIKGDDGSDKPIEGAGNAIPFLRNLSLSIGIHTQGVMVNFLRTGENRLGLFLGFALREKNEEDQPVDGNFYWINYSNSDWKSKSAYHAGLAFRINENIQIGIGYGIQETEFYHTGVGLTGVQFSNGETTTTRKSGLMGIIDFGEAHGLGGQLIGGANGIGAAISYRFNNTR